MVTVAESQAISDEAYVENCSRRAYRLLIDGIESIGGVEAAAGIVGLSRGDLRRCLDRDGRRLALEHAMAIGTRLRLHNASLSTRIASAFVEPFDLEVFPRVRMTTEQENERLRALVRSLPMGEQLLADTLGGRR